jgi:hypothetical protein
MLPNKIYKKGKSNEKNYNYILDDGFIGSDDTDDDDRSLGTD